MIHVYAFADTLCSLPELEGLDGAPLEVGVVDGVQAVFSRRTQPAARGREAVRAEAVVHGRVVETLVELAAAVLPVRFGEGAADEAALGGLVREHAAALRRSLERVRGCVEVDVRVSCAGRVAAADGTEYLHARREASGAALHDELRRHAREVRVGAAQTAYLVPRELR